MQPSILLVMQNTTELQQIKGRLEEHLKGVEIYIASTGIEGLFKFKEVHPTLLLIDDNLPDMKGVSLSTILKSAENEGNFTCYVLDVDRYLPNTRADGLIFRPFDIETLCDQLKMSYENTLMQMARSIELEQAKAIQNDMLPPAIMAQAFHVSSIFSPYNDLSGDGIDYWYTGNTDDVNRLYGFLFDCTGHNLSSFAQVGEIRTFLKKGCQFFQVGVYKDLATVMKSINDDLFNFHNSPSNTAALIFYVDFKTNTLHYCAAGAPKILLKNKGGDYDNIFLKSWLLGYSEKSVFEEKLVSLQGIEKIVISSDGLTELLLEKQNPDICIDDAKHDDVSAILINIH